MWPTCSTGRCRRSFGEGHIASPASRDARPRAPRRRAWGSRGSATSPASIGSASRSRSRCGRIRVRSRSRRERFGPGAGDGLGADGGVRGFSRRGDRRVARSRLSRISPRIETVVDPAAAVPATGRPFDPGGDDRLDRGYDLLRREACWVPAEIVHTDYTGEPDGFFLAGSNGLASGNHLVEAVDRRALRADRARRGRVVAGRRIRRKRRRRLDLASVDDPDCRRLARQYEAAGIDVRVWNATTDIGIAGLFLPDPRPAGAATRAGCAGFTAPAAIPTAAIALARALTEAAQTRLTYIAGIRDDLLPAEYREPPNADIADALFDALARQSRPTAFRDICRVLPADDLARRSAPVCWSVLRAAGIAAGHRGRSDPRGFRDPGRAGGYSRAGGRPAASELSARRPRARASVAMKRRHLRRPVIAAAHAPRRCAAGLAPAGAAGRSLSRRAGAARRSSA